MAINPYSKMNTNTRAPILYGSNAHEFMSQLPSRKWEVGGVDRVTSEFLIFIALVHTRKLNCKPFVILHVYSVGVDKQRCQPRRTIRRFILSPTVSRRSRSATNDMITSRAEKHQQEHEGKKNYIITDYFSFITIATSASRHARLVWASPIKSFNNSISSMTFLGRFSFTTPRISSFETM